MLRSLLFVLAVVGLGWAYPEGPPNTDEICTSMFPTLHNVTAKTSKSPFWTTTSKNKYKAGEKIEVHLWSPQNNFYEGVFVQARKADSAGKVAEKKPVGTFSIPAAAATYMQTLKCHRIPNNAAAHKTKAHKENITVHWMAPKMDAPENIVFEVTYVHETDEFWTEVLSEKLMRDGPSASGVSGLFVSKPAFFTLSFLLPFLINVLRE